MFRVSAAGTPKANVGYKVCVCSRCCRFAALVEAADDKTQAGRSCPCGLSRSAGIGLCLTFAHPLRLSLAAVAERSEASAGWGGVVEWLAGDKGY